MKHKLSLVVLVLVVGIVFLISHILNGREEVMQLRKENEEHAGSFKQENELRKFEIATNGKRINKSFKIFNHDGEINFDEVVTNDKLVFFLSESSCDMCTDSEISNLEKFYDAIGKDNIIILIESDNNRFVTYYRENKFKKYTCYRVKHHAQSTGTIQPFFFILEKESLRINSTFMPQKEKPQHTEFYLMQVIDNYFR